MLSLASFKRSKKLIIAPHIDDESLAMGALLDDLTHIVHCGCALDQNHGLHNFTRSERISEWNKVLEYTGCTSTLLDHPVNNYSTAALIPDFEKLLNSHRPDIVFIPNPSYNQDHQAAYDASIIALRPHDLNHYSKVVLLYYQPQDLWSPKLPIEPNTFVPAELHRHLFVYSLLESQVRAHRGPSMLESMLKLYGGVSNSDYAIPFKCIRMSL